MLQWHLAGEGGGGGLMSVQKTIIQTTVVLIWLLFCLFITFLWFLCLLTTCSSRKDLMSQNLLSKVSSSRIFVASLSLCSDDDLYIRCSQDSLFVRLMKSHCLVPNTWRYFQSSLIYRVSINHAISSTLTILLNQPTYAAWLFSHFTKAELWLPAMKLYIVFGLLYRGWAGLRGVPRFPWLSRSVWTSRVHYTIHTAHHHSTEDKWTRY